MKGRAKIVTRRANTALRTTILSVALVGASVTSAYAVEAPSPSPYVNYHDAATAQYKPGGGTGGQHHGHHPGNGNQGQHGNHHPSQPGGGVLPNSGNGAPGAIHVSPNAAAGAPSGASQAGTASHRGLPFTGLDLLTIVLLGLALVAAGLLLRAAVQGRRQVADLRLR